MALGAHGVLEHLAHVRRRHERLPADHEVTLEAPLIGDARARNVSKGGLLVSLDRNVPVGSRVSLVIRAAAGPPVAMRGEVVRVDKGAEAGFDVAVRIVGGGFEPMVLLRRGN